MCGRYTLSAPADVIAEVFGVEPPKGLSPRYNIAPTQEAAVVRTEEDGQRHLRLLRWGLVPSWADDPAIGNRLINARSETAHAKPAFRSSFRKLRCLVAADGFYEWKKTGDGKQPFWIHRPDLRPFAFAGLWAHWVGGGDVPLETFTILTTDAHPRLAEIHPRMPVVLPPESWGRWLDPLADSADELRALLTADGGEELATRPVSRLVNSPANDSEECIAPLG